MRILFVNGDFLAGSELRATLKRVRGTVDQANTANEGFELAHLHDYDAIVLEMVLSDMDGLEVIERMRAAHVTQPILAVAANASNDVIVRAFSLGADDFLAKPYDLDELVARLQAIVRRTRGRSNGKIYLRAGPLQMDIAAHEVWVNGEPLRLTGTEFAILELLMSRQGSTLTKEAIIEHLYGGIDEPQIKIIDVFICKLRKKLSRLGVGHMVGTVWGRGYGLHQPETAASWNGNPISQMATQAA